jgi:hypothetical protein
LFKPFHGENLQSNQYANLQHFTVAKIMTVQKLCKLLI